MLVSEATWFQIEDYLRRDDRAVLPIGCTEQHAYLSLATDSILAEFVARDAAAPLGVPVFPCVAYGITPSFKSFPGTVSLRIGTLLAVIGDILDALGAQGFKRILIVNGHGGNSPVQSFAAEWMADHPGISVRFHNWWNAPRTLAKVGEIDPVASHASWMESFPWTQIGNAAPPRDAKPMVPIEKMRGLDPTQLRALIGDGNFGGLYQRDDEEMLALWRVAVDETRELINTGWP